MDGLTSYVKLIFVEDARVRRDKARKSELLRVEATNVYHVTAQHFRYHESDDDPALMANLMEYLTTVQSFLITKATAPSQDVQRVRPSASPRHHSAHAATDGNRAVALQWCDGPADASPLCRVRGARVRQAGYRPRAGAALLSGLRARGTPQSAGALGGCLGQ